MPPILRISSSDFRAHLCYTEMALPGTRIASFRPLGAVCGLPYRTPFGSSSHREAIETHSPGHRVPARQESRENGRTELGERNEESVCR